MNRYFTALLPLVLLAGCASSPQSSLRQNSAELAQAEAAIRAADAQWVAAAKAKDLEKTVSYWTDDATLISPDAAPIVGKQAIRDYVSHAFASPDFAITWTTDKIEVARSGELAYGLGVDHITYRGPKNLVVTDKNNALAIWKKQPDGSWKVAVDIFTTEPAAAK
jgi:uncharacterized protein (TIGR02246 family)